MTHDPYLHLIYSNLSNTFTSGESFSDLDKLSTPKERKKSLEKIGSSLSISPLNRTNEDFLLIEAISIVRYFHSKAGKRLHSNMKDFLKEYPEFELLDQAEKVELLEYRNVMSAATQIIPALWNYNHLIDLVARICEGAIRPNGSVVRYVTGSGAKESTKNRVIIYERVGGVTKKVRPPRSFDVLMDILRQRSDPNKDNTSDLKHDSSDSSTVSTLDKAKMDVPIRENSYTACPVNNLVVNTQAQQNEMGLTIQTKSLSKSQPQGVSSDILRSASITSMSATDYDKFPVFDFANDDQCLSFLDTPMMQGFMMNHETTFTPTGVNRHHVSITQNVSAGAKYGNEALSQDVAEHIHHAVAYPPPIKSDYPSGGTSSSSMPPPPVPAFSGLAHEGSNVSSESTSSSVKKSNRGRKRKVDVEVGVTEDLYLSKPILRTLLPVVEEDKLN